MKKTLLFLFIVTIVLSCTKENDTELILAEPEKPKEEVAERDVSMDEKKPLIQITKDDTLKILVRADGAPGMFLNDKDELEGFYVDLEKAVMKEMEQKFELIAYTDQGVAIHELINGDVHNALAAPIVPDFQALLNLSIGFEVLNYVIFLPSESDIIIPDNKEEAIKTLFGKKIGVQTRGHIYQVLRDYKDIEIIEYQTTTVAMEALNRGEIDAVPEVKRVGQYYADLNKWNVKPVGAPIFSLNIGTAFSKALEISVVDRYNVALQTLIDSGYVAKLHKEYFGE